jgi:hypothetical protein
MYTDLESYIGEVSKLREAERDEKTKMQDQLENIKISEEQMKELLSKMEKESEEQNTLINSLSQEKEQISTSLTRKV